MKKAAKPKKPKSAKQIAAQEALQVTWVLKGKLKCIQIYFLKIGALLSQVREKKMYAALGHPDIEDYAEKRLSLGRASLYRYVQAYDWVKENHKEWLERKPKGLIPDLNDVTDLQWIEEERKRKNITAKRKAELEIIRAKTLAGELKKGELEKWRRKGPKQHNPLKSFASKLGYLRMRGSQLAGMPDEVIAHIDAAIAILKNESAMMQSGIAMLMPRKMSAAA